MPLTEEEKAERRAERQARKAAKKAKKAANRAEFKRKQAARHAKWGGKSPPWLREVGRVSLALLKKLAIAGIKLAGQSLLSSGQDKHDSAVSHVLQGAGLGDKPADALAGLIGDVVFEEYEKLAKAGEVD